MARASKYKPEFCDLLIGHMKKGLSFEAFGSAVKVHKDTLYEWVKAHPEFKEAKDEAFCENQLFYERIGIDGMLGKIPGFNVTAWIFNMKNRHGWRDRQKDEAETVINVTGHITKLTDEQLKLETEKEIKEFMDKKGSVPSET